MKGIQGFCISSFDHSSYGARNLSGPFNSAAHCVGGSSWRDFLLGAAESGHARAVSKGTLHPALNAMRVKKASSQRRLLQPCMIETKALSEAAFTRVLFQNHIRTEVCGLVGLESAFAAALHTDVGHHLHRRTIESANQA